MLRESVAQWIAKNLHARYPVGSPYAVPANQRVDDDSLDPDSVADPLGADLSEVTPEIGDLIDLEAL